MNNFTNFFSDLDKGELKIWDLLAQGVVNKKSKFHIWPVELEKRNRKYEEHFIDLLPSRFAEKTEKLISNFQVKQEEKFTFFSTLKLIKFLIYKVRFFIKYILSVIIKFL